MFDLTPYSKLTKVTTAGTMFHFAIHLYFSFLAPYLLFLQWSEQLIGWFFFSFSIIIMITAPIIGALSDSIGRMKIIKLGVFLEFASLLVFIFSTKIILLFFARMVSAIAFQSIMISGISAVNDVSKEGRAKRNGLFFSSIAVATLIAPLIGGFVADTYGFFFLFIVGEFILSLLLLLLFFDNEREGGSLLLKDFNVFSNIFIIFKYKYLRAMAFVGMFTNFTIGLLELVLPLIIVQKLGLTNFHLSIFVLIKGITHVFQYYMGKFADVFGVKKSILFGLGTRTIFIFAMFFVETYEWLLLLFFLVSVGTSLWNVSAWSYISRIAQRHNIEGKIVGSYNSLSRLADAIGLAIVGYIIAINFSYVFLLYGVMMTIASIIFVTNIFRSTT